MSRGVALLLGGLLCWVAAGATAATLTTETDGVRVELRSEPEKPVTKGKTGYVVRLVDTAGKPMTGARVTVVGRMSDGMTVLAALRPAKEAGVYRGDVLFTMQGRWHLRLQVAGAGSRVEVPFTEQVGR